MTSSLAESLRGVTVLERDGRLAVGLCGQLLQGLGATVERCERTEPCFPDLVGPAQEAAVRAVRSGKACHGAESWRALLATADIVLIEADRAEEARALAVQGRIVCAISAFGLDAVDTVSAGEIEIQAQGGLMAATGAPGGPPDAINVPVLEMMSAVNAATTILAALRLPANAPRLLDIALLDSSIALLTTFVGTVLAGKGRGYRLGAAHHLCAPWNAYPTRDGWLQLCSASDDEWRKVLDVIGRADLRNDPRFATGGSRVANVAAVDALVERWTAHHSTEDAVAAFDTAGVPVGRVRRVPDLLTDPARTVRSSDAGDAVAALVTFDPNRPAGDSPSVKGPSRGSRPLAGVRVLEIGPYTAGPLAGRYLADLGAEVIKIEPADGEVSRQWEPKGGPWSVFFANANAGKKFLALDLRAAADRARFVALAKGADVVLTNLKPGALDRLAVGPAVLRERFPRLVFCSISGFGAAGAARPALDTVVQAEAGLMALVGKGGADAKPVRVGVSIADQGAAHTAPLAILAALARRDKAGTGGVIDVSMFDVVAWLTSLTWPTGAPAVRAWSRIEASDGWVMVDGPLEALHELPATRQDRRSMAEALGRRGLRAVPVLELDEVFAHPAVQRRGLLQRVGAPAEAVPLLRAPHRLSPAPPVYRRPCAGPDADRAELLSDAR